MRTHNTNEDVSMCEVVFLSHHRVWCDHVHEHMNAALESHIQGLSKEKNKKNQVYEHKLKIYLH